MKKIACTFVSLLICGILSAQSPCENLPTVKDYNGNVYNTVQIGNQCWMKENMRTKSTATGKRLATQSSPQDGVMGIIAPDGNSDNVTEYGYLYDYNTAMQICPKGWRLPSKADFEELKSYAQTYACDGNMFNINKALSSEDGWAFYSSQASNNNIRNSTGFSLKAAGIAHATSASKDFGPYEFGKEAHLWASDSKDDGTTTTFYYLSVFTDNWKVEVHEEETATMILGCSVRCIRNNP